MSLPKPRTSILDAARSMTSRQAYMTELSFQLASNIVDTIPFIGTKRDAKQERAWPRSGIFTDDGVEMAETPQEIFDLCELLAENIQLGQTFDVFQVFHKIARLDRLIDWSGEGLQGGGGGTENSTVH
ncbi:hypothetical protein [Rhizobium sp. 21-4511-3d]